MISERVDLFEVVLAFVSVEQRNLTNHPQGCQRTELRRAPEPDDPDLPASPPGERTLAATVGGGWASGPRIIVTAQQQGQVHSCGTNLRCWRSVRGNAVAGDSTAEVPIHTSEVVRGDGQCSRNSFRPSASSVQARRQAITRQQTCGPSSRFTRQRVRGRAVGRHGCYRAAILHA